MSTTIDDETGSSNRDPRGSLQGIDEESPSAAGNALPQRRGKRSPVFTVDAVGNAIVRVPLFRGEVTTLDREDWDRLSADGLSGLWALNTNGKGRHYVRTTCRGDTRTLVSVAACICAVSPDEQVTYRDGDRLNLRRSNLLVEARIGRRMRQRPVQSDF